MGNSKEMVMKSINNWNRVKLIDCSRIEGKWLWNQLTIGIDKIDWFFGNRREMG